MMTQRPLLGLGGVVLLLGLAQPPSAAAQFPSRGGWERSGRQSVAYEKGYGEGLNHGDDDARRGREFNYREDREYQRADDGYDRRYGSKDEYQRSYRDGYITGYTAGFDRRGGNGRAVPRGPQYPDRDGRYGYPDRDPRYGYPDRDPRYGYPDREGRYGYPDGNARGGYGTYRNGGFDVGYSEGYDKGLEDARDRDSYDPLRHKWYREGDHNYNSRYGSKEQYKVNYRDGFKEGYERGYREAQRYERNGNVRNRPVRWWPF